MKKCFSNLTVIALLSSSFLTAQVGIGTTNPNFQLDINIAGTTSDGINIANTSFNSQLLSEPTGSIFALNNSNALGNYNIRFNNINSFILKSRTFPP